jgi:hypothetical protein
MLQIFIQNTAVIYYIWIDFEVKLTLNLGYFRLFVLNRFSVMFEFALSMGLKRLKMGFLVIFEI